MGNSETSGYRKEPRIKKNIRVKLKDENGTFSAKITSISRTGMSVKTPHVFPTFKVIDVLVKIGKELIPIKGSVRWVHESTETDTGTATDAGTDADEENEIGIALQNPPDQYTDHFS